MLDIFQDFMKRSKVKDYREKLANRTAVHEISFAEYSDFVISQ